MERFVIAASTLSVPSRIDHLRPVLAFARELSMLAGFSPVDRGELELALEESFTHVVVQGFEMTSQENFQIVFELTAKGMNVTFLEKGLPFDLAEIPPYSPMSGEADMRGIGLFLARKAVDKFEFSYMGKWYQNSFGEISRQAKAIGSDGGNQCAEGISDAQSN